MTSFLKYFVKAPQKDQFQINGQLSPDQFIKAGNHLTQISAWTWKKSASKFISKYLPPQTQYLSLQNVPCYRRISKISISKQSILESPNQDDVVVLQNSSQLQENEKKQQQFRLYNMYIVYDQYYFTPRMFFAAYTKDGIPISFQQIRNDVQSQYWQKTLTSEDFPFIQNVKLATVHPCKHSVVLKTMSDAMRQAGLKVGSQFALLIFLKFISSVIPTVQFDTTGDVHFE